MEIRIYRDLSAWSNRKHFYCAKVECPDTFDFTSAKNLFKSIYGSDIVVEFICL